MKDKILEIIRARGPMLPSGLAKELKTNTTFIGAYLSELIAGRKLLISNLKVGSSPVYYLSGQRARLQVFYKYLNEKEKRAFDLLKKRNILRDREQEPIIRVALGSIKDFAIPLNVRANGEGEIFWKWYLLDDKEAEAIIRKKLEGRKIAEERITKEEAVLEEKRKKEIEQLRQKQEIEKKKAGELQKQIGGERRKIEEEKKRLEDERKRNLEEKGKLEEEKRRVEGEKKAREQNVEKQKTLSEEVKKGEIKKEEMDDPFLSKIKDYCSQNNIKIIDFSIVKKKSDIELKIRVPSVVGEVTYFCKARDKKKVGDGDLSSALVKGQLKKLPVLFFGTGGLTKKAEKEMEGNLKDHIKFKKI